MKSLLVLAFASLAWGKCNPGKTANVNQNCIKQMSEVAIKAVDQPFRKWFIDCCVDMECDDGKRKTFCGNSLALAPTNEWKRKCTKISSEDKTIAKSDKSLWIGQCETFMVSFNIWRAQKAEGAQ